METMLLMLNGVMSAVHVQNDGHTFMNRQMDGWMEDMINTSHGICIISKWGFIFLPKTEYRDIHLILF